MDDQGFFGKNRLYYFWMLKKYKRGLRTDKLVYWMFQKETKEWQGKHELKQRSLMRARNERARAN